MMYYNCPVCGYDQMTEPPEFWNTCPCCGTEFENHTYYFTPEQLRRRWIDSGMKWYSSVHPQPKGWNPYAQLIKAKFGGDLVSASGDRVTSRQERVIVRRRVNWWMPTAAPRRVPGVTYAQ